MSSTTSVFPDALKPSTYRRKARKRVRRWAKKRQGSDKHITRLHSRRIYILPTAVGLVFGLMTFTMLLGSMNYNNNLSFVLTFLLVGIGFVSMHQCQRNLVGLELAFAGVDPVFAGQAAEFKVAITNHSKNRRPHLQIYCDGVLSRIDDLEAGESRVFFLELPTQARGRVRLQRFGVRTLFPFELFRAWAWLHMDLSGLVYPKPADVVPEPPPTQTAHDTGNTMRAAKRISRACDASTKAIRRGTWPGRPTQGVATCCPNSFPELTRVASGLTSTTWRRRTLNNVCPY